VLYDVFGGYREPFIICAVFAIVGVLPARPPTRPHPSHPSHSHTLALSHTLKPLRAQVVPLLLLWRRNEARKKGTLAPRQPRRPRREGELREADALRVLLAVLCALLGPLWIYARWG
jgi:hypothetical protein